MAVVPDQSIFLLHTLKPSTATVWLLFCSVRDARLGDVFLDAERAAAAGVAKSAYYAAISELEAKSWISFSRKGNGKKWYRLLQGFETVKNKQVSTNAENSANMENNEPENSAFVENSANVENFEPENSTNVENPPDPLIRNNPLEETQDSNESFVYAHAYPLRELYAAFPDLELTPGQIGMIEAEVKNKSPDTDAWAATIKIYLANYKPELNRYMPDKIGNVLSVFRAERKKLYGKNKSDRPENTGGDRKSNYEITANRDYAAFEGLDPSEAFKA